MIKSSVKAGLLSAGSSSGPYLANFLGYKNVFVNGVPWSYSQQGDFTSASWNVVGESVATVGPNAEFPNGQLKKRRWNVSRKLIICMFNGQSNTVGAGGDFAGNPGVTEPFIRAAPIPGVLKAFVGGFTPTQDGVNQDGVSTIIDQAQFESDLVPGQENINTGRLPNKTVNRQTWSSAFGQVIADSVTPDNVVLVINVGHGSTTFNECVRRAALVNTATWLAGVVTFVFSSETNLGVGDQFVISNSSPNTWNGTYETVTSDGITVTANKVSDPGLYVGSGIVSFASPPMVNLRTMLRYAVNTIAPALGLTPYLAAFGYNGHESNDDIPAPEFFVNSFNTLRAYVDEFEAIAGNTEPCEIVWPQVGYPVASWRASTELLNCASILSQTLVDIALDPANHCITYPQYSSVMGGAGDLATSGGIHYGVQGHHDNGEIGAHLFLNKKIGDAPYDPPRMLYGEDVLVRVANSTTITGSFSENTMVDTNALIVNPGNDGFQFFAGVTGYGGNNKEIQVSSVDSSPGTALSLTVDSLPVAYGNYVGYAYNNSQIYAQGKNTPIVNATWAGGQATYTTSEPHGLNPGDTVTIALMEPDTYDVIPGQPALAGTTGSTIVMAVSSDPGVFVSGGNLAINGTFAVGRAHGLRGLRRATTGNFNSTSTGAPLNRFNVLQFAPVDVYASTGNIVSALAEVGLDNFFEGVYDFASASCYAGSGTSIVNQGTSGSVNNYVLGDGGLRLPVFSGTPDSYNRSTGLFSTASAEINPVGTPDLLTSAHQTGAEYTIIFGGFMPATITNNNYVVATTWGEGVGRGPGVSIRVASNRVWVLQVLADDSAQAFSVNNGAFAANDWYLGGVSIKADLGTGINSSWSYNSNRATPWSTFAAPYVTPSAAAAQSAMTMMVNGIGGTRYFQNGMGLNFVLVSNSFMTRTVALPLMRTLYRRQIQNIT